MAINSSIFKAYDVRGLYPEEINAGAAETIGRTFAAFLKRRYGVERPRVIVSRDSRLSSPELARAAIAGLVAGGAYVIDAGMTTSPMHYWIVGTEQAEGGIMLTASHNPKEYNGLKLTGRGAEPLGMEDGFGEIQAIIASGAYGLTGAGGIEARDCLTPYLAFLRSRIPQQRRTLTIAVDASNGPAGRVLEPLLAHFPELTVVPLNFEPDGNFPSHDPNPLRDETLDQLKAAMASARADLGVIFDGDGDRVFFLDERTRRIHGDLVTALLAERILKSAPGEAVVYTVPSSRIVKEVIERSGGRAVASKTGHFYVKRAMREADAIFGGEHSGHYYYRETFFAESVMLTLLHVLAILDERPEPLSAVIQPYEKYVRSGELNFTLRDWDALASALRREFGGSIIDEADGITAEAKEWRFNIRKSETEPVARLNAEARDAGALERLVGQLSNIIKSA